MDAHHIQNTGQFAAARAPAAAFATARALYSLTKPNIVGLTLVAALTGIYVGNHGIFPDWALLGWVCLTLGLATAGACMLNNVYDRDIDRLMARTRGRALAAGTVSGALALPLGLGLATLPTALMAATVNTAAAALTLAAVFGYVVVYTMLAKRRTPWANQLGGIAGALPPMIGYAAVSGGIDAAALILFAIMAVWQQPHALSLALKYRGDYARAGVPVIPVAKGVAATKWRIALYTALLFPVALLPYGLGFAGTAYLAASIALGAVFVWMTIRFLISDRDYDMRVFLYSIAYLVALFTVLVMDLQPGFAV